MDDDLHAPDSPSTISSLTISIRQNLMLKPGTLLLLLLFLGVAAGVWLWWGQPPPEAEPRPAAISTNTNGTGAMPTGETAEMLRKQITILEGQVEYLQGQVKALQDENSALVQKIGSLGQKSGPMQDGPATPMLKESGPPDFSVMGADLVSLRKLHAVPMTTALVPLPEVEKLILEWLKRRFPGDDSAKQSRALAALGVIPQPVDILPLRAALMARQLSGWYEEESDTLLLVDPQPEAGKQPPLTDPVLAISFAQLLRDYQQALFGGAKSRLTTDAQLAREAVIGGDAALTRFLYGLNHSMSFGASDLPPSDPDHPFNEVPLPVFLRELHLFAFTGGFQFAQTLHSAGDFKQLTSAYSRPPVSTAEVMDPEIYLGDAPPPPAKIEWPDLAVADAKPYWDDMLGRFAISVILRSHNPDEIAYDATKGWHADRLLAFAAEGKPRDSVVWQSVLSGPAEARAFFKALRTLLLERYDQPADATPGDAPLSFSPLDRVVRLTINRQGTGVLLIDAASADFAKTAAAKFDPSAK